MIKLLNMDCLDYLKDCDDNAFDLAMVDPPYGISINSNMGLRKGQVKRHEEKKWDESIPPSLYFEQLFRVSVNQIIWGGNYFPLGPSRHVIWWEKETPEGMSFSCGELAWTSFNRANRSYTKRNTDGFKIHPTQKPVKLYDWLLSNYSEPGQRVLDTHLGSGSSAVAAHYYGVDFVGIEIDEDYYKAALMRFDAETAQLDLLGDM